MDLGERTRRLSARSPYKVWVWMIGIVLPWGFFLLAVAAQLRPEPRFRVDEPRPDRAPITLGMAGVAVGMTLGSRWLLRRLRPIELDLHERGFVWRQGRSERAIAWADVTRLRDVRHGNLRMLHVETPDGPLQLHAHLHGGKFADAILDAAPRALRR